MLPLETVTPVPATGFFTLAWLLIAIPALSAAILLLVGRRADRWGHLEDDLKSELSGLGLWIDTAALTLEETIAAILANPERSVLTP